MNLDSKNQVNLFLYQIVQNAAWTNADIRGSTISPERSSPVLPLNLRYILTAYTGGPEEGIDSTTSGDRLLGGHRLLGRAMSILHENPILDPSMINDQIPPEDRIDHPFDQREHLRITLHSISTEEISKLWTSFNSACRTSAVYEVSVVLIESRSQPAVSPPVVMQGAEGGGPSSWSGAGPILSRLVLPPLQPTAMPGDELVIEGQGLTGDGLKVRLSGMLDGDSVDVEPLMQSGGRTVKLRIPGPGLGSAAAMHPGFYSVSVLIPTVHGHFISSNALPMAIASIIEVIEPQRQPGQESPEAVAGSFSISITCQPRIRAGQRVHLIVGGGQFPPSLVSDPADPKNAAGPTTLRFDVHGMAAGEHLIRLRVDGVDSMPTRRLGRQPWIELDRRQQLVVRAR
jgi:hypothetical protein